MSNAVHSSRRELEKDDSGLVFSPLFANVIKTVRRDRPIQVPPTINENLYWALLPIGPHCIHKGCLYSLYILGGTNVQNLQIVMMKQKYVNVIDS